MATEWNKPVWDTSYTFSTPGYANYAAAHSPSASPAGIAPNFGLAASTNQFMTGQAQAPYLANLPNYASMVGKRTENIGSALRGEVPQDVVTQLLQQASERGIATGSPGSPNSNASYLRAFGLTSLGQQAQGSRDLTSAIADTPVPQLFNPASLFVPQILAQQGLAAASAGLRGGGGGYGGTSISLPGGRLGGSFGPNPSYGSVGAGPTQGAALGATGPFDEPTPAAGGDIYSNWLNTYGVQANPNSVPYGFSSWDEANSFSDQLASDTQSAYAAAPDFTFDPTLDLSAYLD